MNALTMNAFTPRRPDRFQPGQLVKATRCHLPDRAIILGIPIGTYRNEICEVLQTYEYGMFVVVKVWYPQLKKEILYLQDALVMANKR